MMAESKGATVTESVVLGVDAGGTSTRAVLADASGRVLGQGRSGPGNPFGVGQPQAVAAIVEACLGATSGPVEVAVVMVTMAGAAALGGELPGLATALVEAGIAGEVVVASDALSIYFSATTRPDGGVLIAGTGAVGVCVRNGEVAALVDGLGWLIGDQGSGFWIGHRVIQAVAAAIDGRGPATALTAPVLDSLPALPSATPIVGTPERTRLVRGVYDLRPTELARFAPLIFDHPDDQVARGIVAQAVAALGETMTFLEHRIPDDSPLVIGGGLSGTTIGDALLQQLGSRGLRAADGCVGAVVLGLRRAGYPVNESLRAALGGTLSA